MRSFPNFLKHSDVWWFALGEESAEIFQGQFRPFGFHCWDVGFRFLSRNLMNPYDTKTLLGLPNCFIICFTLV